MGRITKILPYFEDLRADPALVQVGSFGLPDMAAINFASELPPKAVQAQQDHADVTGPEAMATVAALAATASQQPPSPPAGAVADSHSELLLANIFDDADDIDALFDAVAPFGDDVDGAAHSKSAPPAEAVANAAAELVLPVAAQEYAPATETDDLEDDEDDESYGEEQVQTEPAYEDPFLPQTSDDFIVLPLIYTNEVPPEDEQEPEAGCFLDNFL